MNYLRLFWTIYDYFGQLLFILDHNGPHPDSGGEALQTTNEPPRSSGAPLTTKEEEKKFPFHVKVRESENNVEHLRSRGAQSGIF